MAVDRYLHDRLVQWAEWSLQREGGALGYPSEAPYTRMQARSGGGYYSPNVDMDAMEIEAAVGALPDYLRVAVRVYYIGPGTMEQKAQQLGCGRQHVYRLVERACDKLELWMEGRRIKII